MIARFQAITRLNKLDKPEALLTQLLRNNSIPSGPGIEGPTTSVNHRRTNDNDDVATKEHEGNNDGGSYKGNNIIEERKAAARDKISSSGEPAITYLSRPMPAQRGIGHSIYTSLQPKKFASQPPITKFYRLSTTDATVKEDVTSHEHQSTTDATGRTCVTTLHMIDTKTKYVCSMHVLGDGT